MNKTNLFFLIVRYTWAFKIMWHWAKFMEGTKFIKGTKFMSSLPHVDYHDHQWVIVLEDTHFPQFHCTSPHIVGPHTPLCIPKPSYASWVVAHSRPQSPMVTCPSPVCCPCSPMVAHGRPQSPAPLQCVAHTHPHSPTLAYCGLNCFLCLIILSRHFFCLFILWHHFILLFLLSPY